MKLTGYLHRNTVSKELCHDLPAQQSLLCGVFVSESDSLKSLRLELQQNGAEQLWSLANSSSVGKPSSRQLKVGIGLCVLAFGGADPQDCEGRAHSSFLHHAVRVPTEVWTQLTFNKTSILTAWVNVPVCFMSQIGRLASW